MDEVQGIGLEAERIKSSGILGEARVRHLFDYLVTSSLAGKSPKEVAIAIDVFGKNADFDASQDALVRVYVHKLRKALEEFYASHGGSDRGPLQIPRGEYRLKFNPQLPAAEPRSTRLIPPRAAVYIGAIVLAAGMLIAGGVQWWSAPHSDLDRVRVNALWSVILKDERPIKIIVGDYYLIGETDGSMDVKRLIREYSVNSKDDLDEYVLQHPDAADRYMDVGVRYLPISAAFALRNVMAVLGPVNQRISVVKMSDVRPADLKTADIVYIGYLSGLGMMQDLVLTGSRFAIGESYDEVVDKKTHRSYVSQTWDHFVNPPEPLAAGRSYLDYGLFESFRGPGGNTVIVISGTRDAGVQQTAEAFTNSEKLNELTRRADAARPWEALLEVSTFDGVNLSGKVLTASERNFSNAPCTTCKAP